jgi:hypothetical protein
MMNLMACRFSEWSRFYHPYQLALHRHNGNLKPVRFNRARFVAGWINHGAGFASVAFPSNAGIAPGPDLRDRDHVFHDYRSLLLPVWKAASKQDSARHLTGLKLRISADQLPFRG